MLEPTFRHLIETLRYLAGVLDLPLATLEGGVAVVIVTGLVVLGLCGRRRSRTPPEPPVARYAAKLCPTSKTSRPATAAAALPAPGSPVTPRS